MADTLLKTLSDIIRKGNLAQSVNDIKTQLVNNSSVPDYVKLIEREDVTEEEMARQAESYADSLYADKINKVKTDADNKLTELDTRLNNAISNNRAKMLDLNETYTQAKEQNSDKAIKQGIANSSIYAGMQKRAEKKYDKQKTALTEELDSALEAIKKETELINEARSVSLQNYEIKKAAEYEKKLAELREIEYAAREEVRKENARRAPYVNDYADDLARARAEWEDAKKKGQI